MGVETRTYRCTEVATFRRTAETFGGLSNMASGFELFVGGLSIGSSEALYQALRFPRRPDVQRAIISERNAMQAKMRSKHFRSESRTDWNRIRVTVMRWCLRVKLAQHWIRFGQLLVSTGDRPIVEVSAHDAFWGAKLEDGGLLVGMNVLGRLLMELREQHRHADENWLQTVPVPSLPDMVLLERPLEAVESRRSPVGGH